MITEFNAIFFNLTYARLQVLDAAQIKLIHDTLRNNGYFIIPEFTSLETLQPDDQRLSGGTWLETRKEIETRLGPLNTLFAPSLVGTMFVWRRPIHLTLEDLKVEDDRITKTTAPTLPTDEEKERLRLEREMKFFFGCKPTDVAKLPAAPKSFSPIDDD